MRRWMAGFIFIVSVILFSLSVYSLMGMYIEEKKDEETLERVMELYENAKKKRGNKTGEEEAVEIDEGLLALHEENPDCIGWLKIEGTTIDYPVMYHPAKENFYLKRNFYGEYSANGSLFISEACEPKDCDNLIIYGHHMKSGKMFAGLEKYKLKDFYLEHPTVLYRTLYGNEIYQVIAVFCTSVYTQNDFPYYAFVKVNGKEEYDAFIQACKERAFYNTGCDAVYGEKLLTLSTCEYSRKNGRLVVIAKQIRGGD